jgi:hypothetical protein
MLDRYFAGSNARMFINLPGIPEWQELDVVICQWSAGHPHNPLFGVSSRYYDDLMAGQYLIRGGFALNLKNAFELKRLASGTGNALDIKDFDLILQFVYDYYEETGPVAASYYFQNVYIPAISHQVIPDGETVGESYEFFARKATALDYNENSLTAQLSSVPL